MANISLTQKAANALKVDIKNLEALKSANSDDWLVTDIWDSKRDPWLFFMHKQSMMCFVVNPDKYKINDAIAGLLFAIRRYLDDNGLLHKLHFFADSLKTIKLYRNSDPRATANINARRTEIYYREHDCLNDAHLNYVINAYVHTRFGKDHSNKNDYIVMYKAFNNYLQQIPNYGLSSVKKPDYYVVSNICGRDGTISILNTKYHQKLRKFFWEIPAALDINAFCGIAFGLIILSNGPLGAISAVENIASDFDDGGMFLNKKHIQSLLTDLVNSYCNIMGTNVANMYLIDYGVPNPLNSASGNSLYYFSLGLYYTIFTTFKIEAAHQNHPIIIRHRSSFEKIEDFISNNTSRGNKIDYDEYIADLPIILDDLYKMNQSIINNFH